MNTSIRKEPLENPEMNIRLRKLNSATSSTASFGTLPTYTSNASLSASDTKNPFNHPDNASSAHSGDGLSTSFKADKVFQINAHGKPVFSFPTPSKQLKIFITESTEAGEMVRYNSIRPARRSGNCTLYRGDETPVASTTYHFGPGRPPIVALLPSTGANLQGCEKEPIEEFQLTSKSFFSFTMKFDSPRFGCFTWRYADKNEKANFKHDSIKGRPNRLLILQLDGKEVARMIRNDETRVPGTKVTEGNGGRLEIDFQNVGVASEREVEALVVSTCLVMLKKEIDRLRAGQMSCLGMIVS